MKEILTMWNKSNH